ncbi:MAG: hypothetical protein ABI992_05230 [Chthoniobacterales bacterium]
MKSIGLNGSQVYGSQLLDKLDDMGEIEFLEILKDLMAMDYVLSNRANVRTLADAKTAFFRVSPVHARDLRTAINPSRDREKARERRQRRG